MSKESIQGPLSALRNAGTVCGVCLARGSEVLVNLFPFSEARINDVVTSIDDIQQYLQQNGRQIDQLSLGYDGGCLCVVDDDEFRLIVMHMLADEVDFIAKAARAFLADFQLDLFAEQIAAGNTRLEGFVSGNAISLAPAGESRPQSLMEAVRSKQAASSELVAAGEEQGDAEKSGEDSSSLEKETDPEDSGEEESGKGAEAERENLESELEDPVVTARLAANQPESTLPPPRRPGSRSSS